MATLEKIIYNQDTGTEAIQKLDRNQRKINDDVKIINIDEVNQQINTLKSKFFMGNIATDFDEALTQGEYGVIGTTPILHCPPSWTSGSAYGKLIVTVNDGGTHNNQSNWLWQTVYFTDRNLGIWQRQKINQNGWSDWMLISSMVCTPNLLNGWSQYNGHQLVKCIKVGKMSYLVGFTTAGVTDGGIWIMSGIPSIFWPKDVYTIVVNTNGNTAELAINGNGAIVLRQGTVQTGQVISFDGICWESY